MSLNERSSGYKLGIVGIGIGFVLLIVGFASPYWFYQPSGYASVNQGLWQACAHGFGRHKCIYLDISSFGSGFAWLHATRAMECIAVIVYACAVMHILQTNFCRGNTSKKSITVVLSSIAGTLGLIGVIVYGAKLDELGTSGALHWAFGLTIVGSCFAIIGAVIVGLSTEIINQHTPATHGVIIQPGVQMHGIPQYPAVIASPAQYTVHSGYIPQYSANPGNNVVINTQYPTSGYGLPQGYTQSADSMKTPM